MLLFQDAVQWKYLEFQILTGVLGGTCKRVWALLHNLKCKWIESKPKGFILLDSILV